MAVRHNCYERAFAWFLRERRVPTIPVDESRRSFVDDRPVKSLDFVVRPTLDRWLLVDVKGRKVTAKRGTLESWATEDDIEGLGRWEARFGGQSIGLLVFLYDVTDAACRHADLAERFEFEGRSYAGVGISLDRYRTQMRQRSPRWRTVSLNRASFRQFAKPLSHWLRAAPASATA